MTDFSQRIQEPDRDSVFIKEAKRFYGMETDEIAQRLRHYADAWDDTRQVRRIVPMREAVNRLASVNPNLATLVRIRAVGIIEDEDGRLFPCRILDVMWGVNTADMAVEEIKRKFHPKLENPDG